MDENGIMLADTITPDGYYVNSSGAKTSYIPGWFQEEDGSWRYILKNGYYKSNSWLQDTDGKWYYFNDQGIAVTGWNQIGGTWYFMYDDCSMAAGTTTPDGYQVDESGAWIQ